ncbi:hypothetical protein B0H11DRAFT_2286225 [Mycena galericulata]|nr:hypothetical protein B0H11DRAFT_2286225 [Mycena galericulata]
MSSDLSDAQIAKQLFVSRCLIIIPYTILAHDYALTIGQEVERFWGTALTWGTSLFYINRYSALVGTIPVVIEYSLTTNDPRKLSVCDGFESYHQYFALLSQLLVSIMLITRTYALYERNKTVLIITILVTVGAAGFGLAMILTVNDANTLSPHLQTFGCPSATTHSSNLRIAAAWGGMLVFDVMIFVLTVSKALRYSTRSGNLFTVLVRDGAMYFAVMITSNAVNIGTYTMGGPFLSGCATTVTNVLSSVLISRLMLNLRDPTVRLPRRNRSTRLTTATINSPNASGSSNSRRPALGLGTDIALDSVWIEQTHYMEDGEDDAWTDGHAG